MSIDMTLQKWAIITMEVYGGNSLSFVGSSWNFVPGYIKNVDTHCESFSSKKQVIVLPKSLWQTYMKWTVTPDQASLPASGEFWRPIVTFAIILDPGEAPQNVGLHLRSKLFKTWFFENIDKYKTCISYIYFPYLFLCKW